MTALSPLSTATLAYAARESIADIKVRTDLVAIVAAHVALKRRGPREWWGCCPFHRDRTPSFKVDRRRQRYRCFGCGAGGDVIDFLATANGLDTAAAVRRLREMTGNPATISAHWLPPPDDEPDRRAERNRELAQEIWRQTEAIRPGLALPWRYLREVRSIRRWDRDRVRWHGACPWGAGTAGCIVVPVSEHATGLVTAVWRIRPALEGNVERKGLGPTKHNAARLFWAPGSRLVVAEGAEDALAAHALTGLPAWAALSAGNMAELILPARFREVLILADRDLNGTGQENAHKLAARLRAEGRHAEIRRPTAGKDPNDVLLLRRGDG